MMKNGFVYERGGSKKGHDMAGDTSVAEGGQGGSESPRRGWIRAARNASEQQCKRGRMAASEHPMSNVSSESDGHTTSKVNSVLTKQASDTLPCCRVRLDVTRGRGSVHGIVASAFARPERNTFLSKKG